MENLQDSTTPRARAGTSPSAVKKRYELFLATLAETGVVSAATKAAGLEHSAPYKYREKHPDFAEQWVEAMEVASDNIIVEARRRAIDGWLEPVWHNGEKIGEIHKYSDTILCRLLSAADPRYRTSRTEVSNAPGEVLKVEADPIDVARRIAFVFSKAIHNQESREDEPDD